jgi:hypothetical protein
VVYSGWMFTLKVKYKTDKMNKRACIGRRLYITWKANSSFCSEMVVDVVVVCGDIVRILNWAG